MKQSVSRNQIVALLGTPDRTAGSLNSPIELEENGIPFNEKWIYEHLVDDPAGAPMRVIYWHRYDLTGTMVRGGADEAWRNDAKLAEAVAARSSRLARIEDRHEAGKSTNQYRPVSETSGPADLGGYIMGQKPGSGPVIE